MKNAGARWSTAMKRQGRETTLSHRGHVHAEHAHIHCRSTQIAIYITSAAARLAHAHHRLAPCAHSRPPNPPAAARPAAAFLSTPPQPSSKIVQLIVLAEAPSELGIGDDGRGALRRLRRNVDGNLHRRGEAGRAASADGAAQGAVGALRPPRTLRLAWL